MQLWINRGKIVFLIFFQEGLSLFILSYWKWYSSRRNIRNNVWRVSEKEVLNKKSSIYVTKRDIHVARIFETFFKIFSEENILSQRFSMYPIIVRTTHIAGLLQISVWRFFNKDLNQRISVLKYPNSTGILDRTFHRCSRDLLN